jgi:hypothetical protein
MSIYNNGKIYTIRCKNDDTLIYVGSTIQSLHQRWAGHKKHSKTRKHLLIYSKIDDKWDDWYIELYEEYPCENKEQLNKREGEIIRLIGNLNSRIAGRTDAEYEKDNEENRRQYKKEWREKNKEIIIEKRAEKVDEAKERAKQWRETNKEKISIQIQCQCGGHYLQKGKDRHFGTKLHQQWLKQNHL